MVIPPFYLSCYRERQSGAIREIHIDSKELVLEDESIVDAILMKNEGLRTPAQLSVATDTGVEFEFSLDCEQCELGDITEFVAAGGTITIVEHRPDGGERHHQVVVSEVFDTQMDWFRQRASA